jgi:PAS domain S-box-containing protein
MRTRKGGTAKRKPATSRTPAATPSTVDALAQERLLLQALMSNIPDHVYFKDRDSRFIRISNAQARAFGVADPAQAVGKRDFDYFTEEHAQQAYEDEQRVILTGHAVTKEERETWPGRPDTWVLTTKAPLRDETGSIVGTVGISRDITERRRAEEALRETLSLVEATLASAYDGILVVSLEGAVVRANRRFAEMWRIPNDLLASGDDDALLRHVLDQLSDPEVFLSKVKALYGDPVAESADLLEFRDGRVFERTSRPMLVDGEPRARVWSFRDITDRIRAEAEQADLEVRNQQLRKGESLARMAGAIAHHFNNQLQSVLLCLELAKEDLLQASAPTRNVTDATMAANQAAEMSRLMLTYLGQTPGVRESFDLSSECGRWLAELAVTAPAQGTLETALASPGPTISAIRDQMRQLLANLVTNAREAAGAGRAEVRVAVSVVAPAAICQAHQVPPAWQPETRPYACLEVVDRGCGVAEADLERIFDPFYSTKFTGRGLGLAIVQGIVRAHGGVISVQSTPGRGSAFRVYLPLADPDRRASEALR